MNNIQNIRSFHQRVAQLRDGFNNLPWMSDTSSIMQMKFVMLWFQVSLKNILIYMKFSINQRKPTGW